MKVSGSKMGRFLACPSSILEDGPLENQGSPEAAIGSAGHQICEDIMRGDRPDVVSIAERWSVPLGEIEWMPGRVYRAWESLEPSMPEDAQLEPELRVDGTLTCGTADLVCWGEQEAVVLDWDWGHRYTNDKQWQLRAYADALLESRTLPTSGYVLGVHVFARLGEVAVFQFDIDDLDMFRDRIVRGLNDVGRVYGPGADTCCYCLRRSRCEAWADYQRASVTAMIEAELTEVTREAVASLYDRWKAARVACSKYEDTLSRLVKEAPLGLPGGRMVTYREQVTKTIEPEKAWPILEDSVPYEALVAATKVSKSAILEAAGNAALNLPGAKRGAKARAKRELLERLEAAQALKEEVRMIRTEMKAVEE